MSRDDTEFPESFFLPSPLVKAEYEQTLQRGKGVLLKSKVVVAGLARNIAAALPRAIYRIEQLRKMCGTSRAVVFENDSRDTTLPLLRKWQGSVPGVHVLSENLGHPVNQSIRSLTRAVRMAYYRELCQNYIREQFSNYDFVVLIDLDIGGGFSLDGICHSAGLGDVDNRPVDFCASNGIYFHDAFGICDYPVQYDVWAFRPSGTWNPLQNTAVNPLRFDRGEPPIPVNSAFGGLGFYRTTAYLSGKYDGTDCEHVPFHRTMIQAGYTNLFLNPSQVVLYNDVRI